MPVIVSLLRAVNVGGRNLIQMDALRALCGSLGLRDVQTYVQSGNLVFRSPAGEIDRLPGKIGSAIEDRFGFRPAVISRTTAELREAIAKNPFATRRDIAPNKLLVAFLSGAPTREARASALEIECAPEEMGIEARELYIYFANGMARPKLSMSLLEKKLQVQGTGRNWNTVQKLLEMAEALEGKMAAR